MVCRSVSRCCDLAEVFVELPPQPDAAKALMAFLTTPAAKNVMTKHGLETA